MGGEREENEGREEARKMSREENEEIGVVQ